MEAAPAIDAKDDNRIAAVLAVKDAYPGSRQRTVSLFERQRHRKGNLQHLIAARMPRTGKNLIAKGLIEIGHTNHARALQALFLQ